jgi:hypothetical protein
MKKKRIKKMSDYKPTVREAKRENVRLKIEELYNNYGLDMQDMDTDEVDRLIDYYNDNSKQLEKDIKASKTSSTS